MLYANISPQGRECLMENNGTFRSYLEQQLEEERRRETEENAKETAAAVAAVETQSILNDLRGHTPESLLGQEAAQLCKEFLLIMEKNGFPGIEKILGPPHSVDERGKPSVWNRILGTQPPSIPRCESDVLAEGYPIGITSCSFEGCYSYSAKDIRTKGNKSWDLGPGKEKAYLGDKFYQLVERRSYPCYDFSATPKPVTVYLCKDNKIRNSKGGSIPPDYLPITVGGKIVWLDAVRGSDNDRLYTSDYFVTLPLEAALSAHAMANKVEIDL
jgi:hypothetical protein